MAKKSKKNEDLPEGMSRRQAKLAARAAERESLEKDPRPFGGLAMETDLIALQEFVPAAYAKLPVKGFERTVYVATVLPGAGAALIRDTEHGGEAFVALQASSHSQNPGRDLAYALNWVKQAQPGQTLSSTIADGTQPELAELLDAEATLEITEADDFNWWMPEGMSIDPQITASLEAANDAVAPSRHIEAEVPGSLWWVNPGGGKAHIRWVRPDTDENALLNALARVAARGELNLGEETKFAGVFRTHGSIVPVFDLDPARAADSYGAEITRVSQALEAELGNDTQLSTDEHKQLQNIKSRQVTIR
ncbi:DUF5926 family protein [Corynebacterium sp. A21]|uniref:DUF5926 family protein n=1 Tax=Corynebacterium sp. A21 TaxID=3457318 RepID=UPI003FD3E79C